MLVEKEYRCENCGDFTEIQKHTETYERCPRCESREIDRLISLPIMSKDNSPRTLGAQIDLNNKRNPLSREKALNGQTEKKTKYQEKISKISRLDNEQKKRYVEKGIL